MSETEQQIMYFAGSVEEPIAIDELIDILNVMRHQEDYGGYRKFDYLYHHHHHHHHRTTTTLLSYPPSAEDVILYNDHHASSSTQPCRRKPQRRQKSFCSTLFTPNSTNNGSYYEEEDDTTEGIDESVSNNSRTDDEIHEMEMVDTVCHTKMVQWCYQVCKYCNFQNETVEIGMSILIRFMNSITGKEAVTDRSMYQLAAMTCFYTAVKVHEPIAMDPTLVAKLSGGAHTVEEIEMMEAIILQELQWKVNPPTSYEFCRSMLRLIPDDWKIYKDTIYNLCTKQIEYVMSEYDLISVNGSTIAFCSILNSIDYIVQNDVNFAFTNNSSKSLSYFMQQLLQHVIQATNPDLHILYSVQKVLNFALYPQPKKYISLPTKQRSMSASKRKEYGTRNERRKQSKNHGSYHIGDDIAADGPDTHHHHNSMFDTHPSEQLTTQHNQLTTTSAIFLNSTVKAIQALGSYYNSTYNPTTACSASEVLCHHGRNPTVSSHPSNNYSLYNNSY